MGNHEHLHDAERRDTRLRCPKDATLMEKVGIRGKHNGQDQVVSIDRCAFCGAVWLDRTELETILDMHIAQKVDVGPFNSNRQNPRGAEAVGGLGCPRDGNILVQVEDKKQRHVLIDICTDCGGTLLDAGELLDLADYTVMERIKAALGKH